jgi:hypothetical protein
MTDTAARTQSNSTRGNHLAPPRRHRRLIFESIALGVAVYGLLLWIYVAICGIVVPDTLALPLTHLVPDLREDTSGFLGFGISFVGFVCYRVSTRRDRAQG